MPAHRSRFQILDHKITIDTFPVITSFYCLALGTSLSVNNFLDCKSEILIYF